MNSELSVLEIVQSAVRDSGRGASAKGHEIMYVTVRSGAIEELASVVATVVERDHHHSVADVAILMDSVDYRLQEREAKRAVIDQLDGGPWRLRLVVMDDGSPQLHATQTVIDQAAEQLLGATVIVSIGGGTITDIGKMASVALGGVPQIVVQTAASVDGFTDDVSVILIDGVKRTVPSRWPTVVVADVDIVAEAPADLNRAGFGELMSMFVAPADWRMAQLLGMDESFDPSMVTMLSYVGHGIDQWSPGLRECDPASTEALVRALAVRGVATGLAGTTALLSGAEHLISHMLDIHNAATHQPTGAHGAQVGVGSLIASCMWERLFEALEDPAHCEVSPVDEDTFRDRTRTGFEHLPGHERLISECWIDVHNKIVRWNAAIDHVRDAITTAPLWTPELKRMVMPATQLASNLLNAGSPASFAELGVEPELGMWAVRNCGYMRNRLTVVDLLDFLGLWSDAEAYAVLAKAQALVEAHV